MLNLTRRAVVCVGALGVYAGVVLAQSGDAPPRDFDQPSAVSMDQSATLAWMKRLGIDPNSEEAKDYLAQQDARRKAEKALRKLRYTHFTTTHAPTRAAGIAKLKEFTDPALFPLMIDIFAREESDVRLVVLDTFAAQAGREGDAALTWEALFDSQRIVRDEAMLRLQDRIRAEGGKAPESVRLVLYQAFRSGNPTTRGIAAGLADTLSLVEVIPWMITTQLQVQGGGGNSGDVPGGRGSLAFIAIGQQTAYVSDLQPVVSDNAVGFDPQVSVINTGTVVRIDDAVVYSYNLDVHNALVRMSSRLWGQATDDFGWDYRRWMAWYKTEFTPYWATKQAERAKAKEAAGTPETAGAPKSEPGMSKPK